MVTATKKHITTDLLHIALILALLRGDQYQYQRPLSLRNVRSGRSHIRSPSPTRNLRNELNIQNLGPSWGYTSEIISFGDDDNPFPGHHMKNDLTDFDNQLRTLSLIRYNTPSFPNKGLFQDVTAFLVDSTINSPIEQEIDNPDAIIPLPEDENLAPFFPNIEELENLFFNEVEGYTDENTFVIQNEDSDLKVHDENEPEVEIGPNVDLNIDLNLDLDHNLAEEELVDLLNLNSEESEDDRLHTTNTVETDSEYNILVDNFHDVSINLDEIGTGSDREDIANAFFIINKDEESAEDSIRTLFEEPSSTFRTNHYEINLEDLMNAVSPYEIQKVVTNGQHSEKSPKNENVNSNNEERPGTSSSNEPESVTEEKWETDSGIFDSIFDSPGIREHLESEDLDQKLFSNSELSEEWQDILFDGDSSEDSGREADDSNSLDMLQTAQIHTARPTTQPRGFQVHARMPGLLRSGSSMDQRWQELASILSLPNPHDPSHHGGPLPPTLQHHFPPPHHHHHHYHHAAAQNLHHHPIHHHHHPSFSNNNSGPSATPYNTDSRSSLLQNTDPTLPYSNIPMGPPPPNLGTAVASSMHLTNSDPMITNDHYKMMDPSSHDMLYYPNTSSSGEMNSQTTEGLLSSILNDDDLQLMDMAMNEGMYTMRMIDNPGSGAGLIVPNLPHSSNCPSMGNGASGGTNNDQDRMEASSDSAVSSMGSERVPPMTDPDGEWGDEHQHSSHDSYTLDYSSGKLRGYDYPNNRVAQKKHQMFGKRFQQGQEQGIPPYGLGYQSSTSIHLPYPGSSSSLEPLEMKYSCAMDFARHHNDVRVGGASGGGNVDSVLSNHTYSIPPSQGIESQSLISRIPRIPPNPKEKTKKEHLSRDEKRARAMNLPMTTDDIINLPMDEFNERLSKYDLSEAQLSLIRDIRRRGKNKVAAQNCRKRKLDQILQLADEVTKIRETKGSLLREQEALLARRNNLKDKYAQLYKTVFQALRDPDGHPYSPYGYSLQQAADGNIILVPKSSSNHPSTSEQPVIDSSSNSQLGARRKPKDGKDGQS